VQRHFPDLIGSEKLWLRFFERVCELQGRLIAAWNCVGFIHGVMNTDNMLISGESIDFGPCAFMDEFDPNKVFSSIDERGRYAYKNQGIVGKWNLARLAETLLHLVPDNHEQAKDELSETLSLYDACLLQSYTAGMRLKFGLLNEEPGDGELIQDFLLYLKKAGELDYTLSFQELIAILEGKQVTETDWHSRWELRVRSQKQSVVEILEIMKQNNPVYIPRNHWVEEAIQKAYQEDYTFFHKMCEVLKEPYQRQLGAEKFEKAPMPDQRVQKTFCGT
jgi:uncharacterized protein YdiU (UPF0061 family)